MKKVINIILICVSGIIFAGCTDNQRVKHFGGSEEIQLKPNEKLIDLERQ